MYMPIASFISDEVWLNSFEALIFWVYTSRYIVILIANFKLHLTPVASARAKIHIPLSTVHCIKLLMKA